MKYSSKFRAIEKQRRRRYELSLLLLLVLIITSVLAYEEYVQDASRPKEPDAVRCHVIDVGFGSSMLIESPKATVLIDTGPYSLHGKTAGYLQKADVRQIDLLILTNTSGEHIGDFASIAQRFPIGKVWVSDFCRHPSARQSEDESTFEDTIGSLSIPVQSPAVGNYQLEDMRLCVLSPDKKAEKEQDNSLVVRIECGSFSCLCTGDATTTTERKLLQSGQELRSDLLAAGCHGANTASSDAFLRAVKPDCTVISVGRDMKWFPGRACVERIRADGCMFLRTDLDGTIVVTCRNGKTTYTTSK